MVLNDEDGSGSGGGATVKIATGGSGQTTGVEIVDGGSAYGVGLLSSRWRNRWSC